MRLEVTYRDAERGRYHARLIAGDTRIGYVRREAKGSDYRAYVDGLMVASGRTLEELRADRGCALSSESVETTDVLRPTHRLEP